MHVINRARDAFDQVPPHGMQIGMHFATQICVTTARCSLDRFGRGARERRGVAHDLFDARQRALRQRDIGRRECFVNVVRITRADNRHVHTKSRERPRNGQLANRDAEFALGEVRKLANSFEIVAIHLTLEVGALRTPVARRERSVETQSTAEHAVRQRSVDEHADVVRDRVGKDLRLDVSVQEMIRGLQGLHGQALSEGIHLCDVTVRHADVTDLASGNQLGQRVGRLFERRVGVWPVHLVEVDVVRVERAMERGEIASTVDVDVALDLLFGPAYLRLLQDHLDLDDRFAHSVVDTIMDGLLGKTNR